MAYIGKTPITGNFVKLDAISVVNGQAGYTMNNGGSAFTDYENVNQFLVSLNGILQAPTTSFTVSGSTLTFASNLATGDVIDFVIVLGSTLDIGTPSDATVTQAKTNFVSTSSAAGLQIKGDGTTDGTLQLNCSQNSHGIKLKSPPHSASASYTLTFPNDDGDNGEVLTTNGSGVLTWNAVSSDYVLLSTVDITSSTAEAEFDGLFSSTYKNYKIIISGLLPVTNAARLRARYLVSSSAETSSNYGYIIGDMLAHSSGDSSAATEQNAITQDYMLITSEMSNTSTLTNSVDLTLFNPLSTTQNKAMFWTNQNRGSVLTRLLRGYVGTGVYEANTSALSGVKFYMDSGNIAKGNFKLYGLK